MALEALRGDETIREIAARHEVHPNQVGAWKRQAVEGLGGVFESGAGKPDDREGEVRDLRATIGELTAPNDFVSRALDRRSGASA